MWEDGFRVMLEKEQEQQQQKEREIEVEQLQKEKEWSQQQLLVAMKNIEVEEYLQVGTVECEKMSNELNESRAKNKDINRYGRGDSYSTVLTCSSSTLFVASCSYCWQL